MRRHHDHVGVFGGGSVHDRAAGVALDDARAHGEAHIGTEILHPRFREDGGEAGEDGGEQGLEFSRFPLASGFVVSFDIPSTRADNFPILTSQPLFLQWLFAELRDIGRD